MLVKAGKRVTVLEAQDRVLARVAGEAGRRFYEAEHRAHGVDVRLGVGIEAIEGTDGRVTGVRTAGGTVPAAGRHRRHRPRPRGRGAGGGRGGRPTTASRSTTTAAPRWPTCSRSATAPTMPTPSPTAPASGSNRCRTPSTRRRSSPASSSARRAPYHAVPWFWSNQYDLKLQTVGLSAGHDATLVRGDPAARSWSLVYLRGGRVIALDCINAARDFVQGKALVEAGLAGLLPTLPCWQTAACRSNRCCAA